MLSQRIKKKAIIYCIAIALILTGAGVLIYQKRVSAPKNAVQDAEGNFRDDSRRAGMVKELNSAAVSGVGRDALIGIFNDPKFRALKDNSVGTPPAVNVGRNNPFQPY